MNNSQYAFGMSCKEKFKRALLGSITQKTLRSEGKTLFILIKSVLQDLRLNIKSMVGQCYDGATT